MNAPSHKWLLTLALIGLMGLLFVVGRAIAQPMKRPIQEAVHGASGNNAAQQEDVYGVVLGVKTVQRSPERKGLPQPVNRRPALQQVTVRLNNRRALPMPTQIVQVRQALEANPAFNVPVQPGARVLLRMEKDPQSGQWRFDIADRDRTPAIMILGVMFILAVLLIGGLEVTKHSLLVVLILIGCHKALFPAVLGQSTGPNWILLLCFTFTILASFIYQQPGSKSFSREQSVVILGTTGGTLILTLVMTLMHEIAPLNGYGDDGLAALWYRSPRMDYWSFLMAGVLLSFQGFLFHLCWMLAQNRKEKDGGVLDFRQRFAVVMLRGRRLLGPMLSSLGMLFLGLFMPLLLQLQGTPTAQFVNLESTATMLTYAFAGGLTLVLTVPLTALIAAWLLGARVEEKPDALPSGPTEEGMAV